MALQKMQEKIHRRRLFPRIKFKNGKLQMFFLWKADFKQKP
jgi:hypothetical protein